MSHSEKFRSLLPSPVSRSFIDFFFADLVSFLAYLHDHHPHVYFRLLIAILFLVWFVWSVSFVSPAFAIQFQLTAFINCRCYPFMHESISCWICPCEWLKIARWIVVLELVHCFLGRCNEPRQRNEEEDNLNLQSTTFWHTYSNRTYHRILLIISNQLYYDIQRNLKCDR